MVSLLDRSALVFDLKCINVFRRGDLKKEQFLKLIDVMEVRSFEKDRVIFSADQQAEAALYLVLEGGVWLTRPGMAPVKLPSGCNFGEELLAAAEGVPGCHVAAPYTVESDLCKCAVLTMGACRQVFDIDRVEKTSDANISMKGANKNQKKAAANNKGNKKKKKGKVSDSGEKKKSAVTKKPRAKKKLEKEGSQKDINSKQPKSKKQLTVLPEDTVPETRGEEQQEPKQPKAEDVVAQESKDDSSAPQMASQKLAARLADLKRKKAMEKPASAVVVTGGELKLSSSSDDSPLQATKAKLVTHPEDPVSESGATKPSPVVEDADDDTKTESEVRKAEQPLDSTVGDVVQERLSTSHKLAFRLEEMRRKKSIDSENPTAPQATSPAKLPMAKTTPPEIADPKSQTTKLLSSPADDPANGVVRETASSGQKLVTRLEDRRRKMLTEKSVGRLASETRRTLSSPTDAKVRNKLQLPATSTTKGSIPESWGAKRKLTSVPLADPKDGQIDSKLQESMQPMTSSAAESTSPKGGEEPTKPQTGNQRLVSQLDDMRRRKSTEKVIALATSPPKPDDVADKELVSNEKPHGLQEGTKPQRHVELSPGGRQRTKESTDVVDLDSGHALDKKQAVYPKPAWSQEKSAKPQRHFDPSPSWMRKAKPAEPGTSDADRKQDMEKQQAFSSKPLRPLDRQRHSDASPSWRWKAQASKPSPPNENDADQKPDDAADQQPPLSARQRPQGLQESTKVRRHLGASNSWRCKAKESTTPQPDTKDADPKPERGCASNQKPLGSMEDKKPQRHFDKSPSWRWKTKETKPIQSTTNGADITKKLITQVEASDSKLKLQTKVETTSEIEKKTTSPVKSARRMFEEKIRSSTKDSEPGLPSNGNDWKSKLTESLSNLTLELEKAPDSPVKNGRIIFEERARSPAKPARPNDAIKARRLFSIDLEDDETPQSPSRSILRKAEDKPTESPGSQVSAGSPPRMSQQFVDAPADQSPTKKKSDEPDSKSMLDTDTCVHDAKQLGSFDLDARMPLSPVHDTKQLGSIDLDDRKSLSPAQSAHKKVDDRLPQESPTSDSADTAGASSSLYGKKKACDGADPPDDSTKVLRLSSTEKVKASGLQLHGSDTPLQSSSLSNKSSTSVSSPSDPDLSDDSCSEGTNDCSESEMDANTKLQGSAGDKKPPLPDTASNGHSKTEDTTISMGDSGEKSASKNESKDCVVENGKVQSSIAEAPKVEARRKLAKPPEKGKRRGVTREISSFLSAKKTFEDQEKRNKSQTTIRPPKNVSQHLVNLPKNYVPPSYPKSEIEESNIRDALNKRFVFQNLPERTIESMVAAFEKKQVPAKNLIIEQGKVDDYFYVVSDGECEFEVDGVAAGITKRGDSFGEDALVFLSPRDASVRTMTDASLFRVDQTTFRRILQHESLKDQKSKRKILEKIEFLQGSTPASIQKLTSIMSPVQFKTGDTLAKASRYGDSFCVLTEGKAVCKDVKMGRRSRPDKHLGPGDHFGKHALIEDPFVKANVVALSDGKGYAIDREKKDKIMGTTCRIPIDARSVSAVEAFDRKREKPLKLDEVLKLSSAIQNVTFAKGETIVVPDTEQEAAVYFLREGRVHSQEGRQIMLLTSGTHFGERIFMDARKKKTTTGKSPEKITAEADCICGVLWIREYFEAFGDKYKDTAAALASGGGRKAKSKSDALSSTVKTKSISRSPDRKVQQKKKPANRGIPLENLKRQVCLGEGEFGQIWLCSDNREAKPDPYVLKIMSKSHLLAEGEAEMCIREKNMLMDVSHPFIVDLISTYQDDSFVFMLLDFVQGGELFSVMNSPEGRLLLEESDAKFYALAIADALAYLHKKKYVYRDLKPENVMIDYTGYPKLIDFGFTKKITDQTFTFCGTPGYLAPEMVLAQGHNWAVDHWALGVLIYEMLSGSSPFYEDGIEQFELFRSIAEDDFPHIADISPQAYDLISQLLKKDPSIRLGSLVQGEKDILEHAWFEKMKLQDRNVRAPWTPSIKDPFDTSNFDDWSDVDDKTLDRGPGISKKQAALFDGF